MKNIILMLSQSFLCLLLLLIFPANVVKLPYTHFSFPMCNLNCSSKYGVQYVHSKDDMSYPRKWSAL